MRQQNKLGPRQELLIVKMYNFERGIDNHFSARDCNAAALNGKVIQPLVERCGDCHLWKLTHKGVAAARDLVFNGSYHNPLVDGVRKNYVYAIKESGHWKRTVRVEIDRMIDRVYVDINYERRDNGHPLEPMQHVWSDDHQCYKLQSGDGPNFVHPSSIMSGTGERIGRDMHREEFYKSMDKRIAQKTAEEQAKKKASS